MNKLTIPTLLLSVIVAIYLILLQLGCASCIPTETRCANNTTQICGSDGIWRDNISCGENAWQCCWNEEYQTHSCELPEGCAE
jgi:hypothetical protein